MQRMIVRTFVDGVVGPVMAKLAKGAGGLERVKEDAERSLRRMKDFRDKAIRHEVELIMPETFSVGETLAEVEKRLILATLAACGGNKTQAADTLGISRRSIYNKLAEYRETDPVCREALPTKPTAETEGPAAQVA